MNPNSRERGENKENKERNEKIIKTKEREIGPGPVLKWSGPKVVRIINI